MLKKLRQTVPADVGKKAILRIRHAKSGMVRDTDTYYEYKTPIYKFIAYENNFTRN